VISAGQAQHLLAILAVTKVLQAQQVQTVVQIHVLAFAVQVLPVEDRLLTVACAHKAAKAAYHTAWTTSQLISALLQAAIAVQE
jgi:hypothetical protein